MENGQEGNQNSNHRTNTAEQNSASDTSDMEDTVEFRILMAYAQRRRPKKAAPSSPARTEKMDSNGTAPAQTPDEPEQKEASVKKKKKKKGLKRFLKIFKCVQPQTEEETEPQQIRVIPHDDEEKDERSIKDDEGDKKDALAEVASRLTEIADEIPFVHPDIEEDTPCDVNVERAIGLILRETGDRVNEQELKKLQELFWDYSFFQSIIKTLLMRMGLKSLHPDSPGPHASPKTQIAVACEAISRLSAMDTQPMNKLLGFGARYLTEQHSPWVKEQGGYEAAFEDDDEVQ